MKVLTLTVCLLSIAAAEVGRAENVQCFGFMTGVIEGNVVVPAGSSCRLFNAIVTGNVFAEPAAVELGVVVSEIGGNIDADSVLGEVQVIRSTVANNILVKQTLGAIGVRRAEVGGNIDLVNNSGPIHVGRDPEEGGRSNVAGSVSIRFNTGAISVGRLIAGRDLVLFGNSGGLFIGDSELGGALRYQANTSSGTLHSNLVTDNFLVLNNAGPTTLLVNQIGRMLQCRSNEPPPVGAGNTADKADGQCEALVVP